MNHIPTIVDGQYMNLFLNSYIARQYGNIVKTDGVNQSNINGTKLSNYPFPYCSIEEQREIARILEITFSILDETEADIVQELQKADALRQSILKKAFSDQLVPQDPDDEPGSSLLERIKAEKLHGLTTARGQKQRHDGNRMTGKLPINIDHLLLQHAIEEALVNAIYHRSYEEREPVEVRITREELLVLSYPGADRSIRMDDFKKGQAKSRRYRNRRIGEFLKELDLAEARSTGVPKIFRAMRQNGSPEPIFESDEDRTWFRVRLPVHERALRAATEHDTIHDKSLKNNKKG